MLGISFAQPQSHRPLPPELAVFFEIKLVVLAFTLLLQEHELVVSAGNWTLEFRAGAAQVRTVCVDLLLLLRQLGPNLFPSRIFSGALVAGVLFHRSSRVCGR